MDEEWKDIEGYEGIYAVSSWGRVRDLRNGHFYLNDIYTRRDYVKIQLFNNGSSKAFYAHRLVANAFLKDRLSNQKIVNHKNGIRSDNHIENLEWCDYAHNTIHTFAKKKLLKHGIKSFSAYEAYLLLGFATQG